MTPRLLKGEQVGHYTEMGAHPDQSARARKQARQARRLIIAQRQERRQRILEDVRLVFEILVGAFILYWFMFLACL